MSCLIVIIDVVFVVICLMNYAGVIHIFNYVHLRTRVYA